MNKITTEKFINTVIEATKSNQLSRFHIKESDEMNIIRVQTNKSDSEIFIEVPEVIPAEHFAENKYEYLLGALGDALNGEYEINILRHHSGLKDGYMIINDKVLVTFKYVSKA